MEVIRNTSGHFLQVYKGKETLVTNLDKATYFEDGGGQFYIDNQIRKSIRDKFFAVTVDEKNDNEEQAQKDGEISSDEAEKDDAAKEKSYVHCGGSGETADLELDRLVDNFTEFLKYVSTQKQPLEEQLSYVDMEICDLLHAAEFYKLNIRDSYKLYKLLRDARIRRREIKDKIMKIDIIQQSTLEDWKKGNVSYRINNLGQRKYTPRVLTDLFEQFESYSRKKKNDL